MWGGEPIGELMDRNGSFGRLGDNSEEKVFERLFQVSDLAVGDYGAFGDYGEPVTDAFDIGQYVRIEEDGLTLVLELDNEIFYHFSSKRIEPAHWFVQEYHFRIVDDRLRESDALEHSFRIFRQSGVARVSQSDFFEQFVNPLLENVLSDIEEFSVESEKFPARQVFVQVRVFRHETDAASCFLVEFGAPEYGYAAGGGLDKGEDALHRGSLSCPVRSEKTKRAPHFYGESYVRENGFFVDGFAEFVDADRNL